MLGTLCWLAMCSTREIEHCCLKQGLLLNSSALPAYSEVYSICLSGDLSSASADWFNKLSTSSLARKGVCKLSRRHIFWLDDASLTRRLYRSQQHHVVCCNVQPGTCAVVGPRPRKYHANSVVQVWGEAAADGDWGHWRVR